MVGNKMSYKNVDESKLSPYLETFNQAYQIKIYGKSVLEPFYQPDIDKSMKTLRRIQNKLLYEILE